MGKALPAEKCPNGGYHQYTHNGDNVAVCVKCGKTV